MFCDSVVTFSSYSNRNNNLTFNDWLETYKTPDLEERIAAGLVRLTLQGVEQDSEEDYKLLIKISMQRILCLDSDEGYQIKYFTLGQILLSKGLKIPILQEEALTDEWISIKIRINNYLRINGELF